MRAKKNYCVKVVVKVFAESHAAAMEEVTKQLMLTDDARMSVVGVRIEEWRESGEGI